MRRIRAVCKARSIGFDNIKDASRLYFVNTTDTRRALALQAFAAAKYVARDVARMRADDCMPRMIRARQIDAVEHLGQAFRYLAGVE